MRPFPVIRNFKQYFWKNLVPALLIATGGILFLNFFLAYRLENYLKEVIKERAAEASDGFYSLTFDDLSINVLNGELRIEGIRITPDSVLFSQWQAKDSLPFTYLDASIQSIDFKGINLIWLKNYRQLNFRSFEIRNPIVSVTDAFYSDRRIRKVPVKRSKTLYEYIEPYIDILSVDHLNIENAYTSFHIQDPLDPILYKIDDIDLYAYNFRLDSSSFENGKLLYCDDFEFISDRPQAILSNRHFQLETDTILLNTKDSLIYLKDIRLVPQKRSVSHLKNQEGDYIKGSISYIKTEGAAFKRINAFNTMRARELKIENPEVSFITHKEEKPSVSTDSLSTLSSVRSFSLYNLISPVLNRLEVNTIDIRDSRLDYLAVGEQDNDTIQIGKLNLSADHFIIDSLYEKENGFRYIKDLRLTGEQIAAYLPSSNYQVHTDTIEVESGKGILYLRNAMVRPISSRKPEAFFSGKIPLLSMDGLTYETGLEANNVTLRTPDIHFTSAVKKNNKVKSSPFSTDFRYLRIKNILVDNGNMTFSDRGKKNVWHINNIVAGVSGFRMDKNTLQDPGGIGFTCEQLNFKIRQFDNQLNNGKHRLKIRNGFYSDTSGKLEMKDIELIPQKKEAGEAGTSQLALQVPRLSINGLQNIWRNPHYIQADTIQIEHPAIQITDAADNQPDSTIQKAKEYSPFQPFRTLDIKYVDIIGTQLQYTTNEKQKLEVAYKELQIDELLWNLEEERTLEIQNFRIGSPQVNWQADSMQTSQKAYHTVASPKAIPELLYPYAEKFSLQKLWIDTIGFRTQQPYLETSFHIQNVELDSLLWSFQTENKKMDIGSIVVEAPEMNIERKPSPVLNEKQENDTIQSSIYDQLKIVGDEIAVHNLEVKQGNLSFTQPNKLGKPEKQKINTTDLFLLDLHINNNRQTFGYDNVRLQTRNLSIPIDDGFYTLDMESVLLDNKDVMVENFHLNPAYEKTEFAYRHPRHKDWFDVTFDRLEIKEMDLMGWFKDSVFHAAEVIVEHPVMQNYKNKKIYVAPKWMPMIYEGLQKAPVTIDIDKIQVNDFNVVYEELSKKGVEPGKLVFTELNGTITGFTNIVSAPDQYIRLDADGKFYGEGHFNAVWLLPVDSLNDRFILEAHLPDMDLTLLNEMIMPLASARLKSGQLTDLTFLMDAGSIGGSIDMLFLYDDLKVDIFAIKEGERKSKKFLNFLVNAVVRDNNPNQPTHPRSKPRHPFVIIERDPYHSSFNYLWQLLRPAVTESVGITPTQQKIAGKIAGLITKVKNLLDKGKKEEQYPVPEISPED